MSYSYAYDQSMALAESRAAFIRRTYMHVAGAVVAFALLLALFYQIAPLRLAAEGVVRSRWGWLLVMIAFMGGGWVANQMAADFTSKNKQYAGLGLYVALEALIFLPIISLVMHYGKPGIISQAVLLTSGLFLALSSVVFITKHSFSWMKSVVTIGSILALAAIVGSIIFGFSLGFVFICLMIGLMAASILYTTGQVMRDYPEWAYVSASLALFSALATLFWYVIQFVMSMSSDD